MNKQEKQEEITNRIGKNWDKFEKLCGKLGDRSEKVLKMLDDFSERAALAPASSRVEYHNAFPGGLVDHSLRVLKNALKLAEAMKLDVSQESIIISALFHDWGKVGDLKEPYYVEQKSDWHRNRGIVYDFDGKCVRMTTAQRGLFIFQHYGITLSSDEYLAILLNDGQYVDENRHYRNHEPSLALIIHHADILASRVEKGRESLLDDEKSL